MVIDGPKAGSLIHVCRDEKCPVHSRSTRYQPTPKERAARAKEALAERIEKQMRLRTLDAVRKKLPTTISRPDLEMVARDYFQRLGHDNHRRVCRVYGWEEKKNKTTWGTQAVDYEGITANNPQQTLAKDSNLARTAVRYKVDVAKMSATVREELSKPAKGASPRKNKATRTKSK